MADILPFFWVLGSSDGFGLLKQKSFLSQKAVYEKEYFLSLAVHWTR